MKSWKKLATAGLGLTLASTLLVTWLYKLTVSAADYNLASVIGILIFALSAIFSLLAYTRTASYKEGVAK